MLDISWTELFVVAVVAILVIGPRDLPRTLRSVGNFVGQARRMAGDFQRQFDQALREAELDEVKKSIDSVRKADPRNQIRDAVKDVAGVGKNLKKDIESTGTTGAKSAGKSGADETAAAPAAKTPASKASAAKTPTAAKPATAKSAAAKSTPAKAPAKAATTKIAAAKTAKAPARKSTATAKKAAGTARSASAKSGSAAGATGSKTAPAKS